ncbi:hypothetical protein FPZ42_11120 [Mucilaginibacter achroorhodeus]|uniref:Uncharacterized protein n=1 Tax=Mucilaginibacter achroorhodeus TaxID=2599294 RepID=A0A563U493_9SPHI|nr:hypothetical protein [Mucilaginibacter achroorhodeus]TWR26170.1 hypothetical protein FPZ42_11120 [Mucilaginibacter achroorhodeus]
MITTLHDRYLLLRIALGIIIIAAISCKVVAPLALHLKPFIKEFSTGSQEDSTEKKAEQTTSEKENFFDMVKAYCSPVISGTQLVHLTAYNNNYKTSYFNSITIPPPDIF